MQNSYAVEIWKGPIGSHFQSFHGLPDFWSHLRRNKHRPLQPSTVHLRPLGSEINTSGTSSWHNFCDADNACFSVHAEKLSSVLFGVSMLEKLGHWHVCKRHRQRQFCEVSFFVVVAAQVGVGFAQLTLTHSVPMVGIHFLHPVAELG